MSSAVELVPESYLDRFHLPSFRPGQREVISKVFEGSDCLCVMPTGGGKSLCYQLPSIARQGTTLVVSPLIALMKDQVDRLLELGLKATYINSTLGSAEQAARIDRMSNGEYDLVYIAPERLRNRRFTSAAGRVNIQLLAVDEAHCISEWGHDFRPDYARIGEFRERLGFPQTIALTATATPIVREDVMKLLKLKEPSAFITGFSRPNLSFEVAYPSSGLDKNKLLLDLLRETSGAGLVYAATRKRCTEIVEMLQGELREPVGIYHGGMALEDRKEMQESFMQDEVRIMVATNAFGMGIDKKDLRAVAHYNMPGSIEAYYQEAGRAGRDGLPSRCLLLFSYSDRYVQEFFIENRYPGRKVVKDVYDYLRRLDDDPIELTQMELKERLEASVSGEGIGACEQLLEKCGALERIDSQHNLAQVKIDSDLPTVVDLVSKDAKVQRKLLRAIEKVIGDRRREWVTLQPQRILEQTEMSRDRLSHHLRELRNLECFDYIPPFRGKAIRILDRDRPFSDLDIDFAELERRKKAELEKLDKVVSYARTRLCRQAEILDYFGDRSGVRCGECDNCGNGTGKKPSRVEASKTSNPSVLAAVRMALSGVARARGRFGRQIVVQMLCGSKSGRLKKWKLDQLSTFGLFRELTQVEANELFDVLLEEKLVEQNDIDRFRPVIKLTDYGREVMKGRVECELVLPGILHFKLQTVGKRHPTPKRTSKRPTAKKEEAEREASESPGTESSKPEESVVEETEQPLQENDGPAGNAIPPETTNAKAVAACREITSFPTTALSHQWTWHLFDAGLNVEQCAEIRQLGQDALLDHILRAAEEGLSVKAEWFLSQQQIQELDRQIQGSTKPRIRPLMDASNVELRYELVQLYLKARNPES